MTFATVSYKTGSFSCLGNGDFCENEGAGLFVAQLLTEELLAAFAAGYHKDPEQDEDSGGYFGECELVLTHHDGQHRGDDGDAVVVDADDGRAQASLCEEQ